MRLVENIVRTKNHFQNAKSLKDRDLSDYSVYNTLAMECFQAAKVLITLRTSGSPSAYCVQKQRLPQVR